MELINIIAQLDDEEAPFSLPEKAEKGDWLDFDPTWDGGESAIGDCG